MVLTYENEENTRAIITDSTIVNPDERSGKFILGLDF